MRISDMTESHIMNCIRMIEMSGGAWRGEYLERLKLELEIRGYGLSSGI